MPEVFNVFQKVSEFSILVPIIIGAVLFKSLDRNSLLIFSLVVLAGFPQLAGHYANNEEQTILYNCYTVLDLIIWGYLYYLNNKNSKIRFFIMLSVLGFVMFSVLQFIIYGIRSRFISELVCLVSLMQVCFILAYFYNLYQNEDWLELEKSPIFWFSLGLLIYAPVTYFHFAFYVNVTPDLRIIHNIINTIMYLVFSIGLITNIFYRSKTFR